MPTRLWYSGLADSETWALPPPEDLAAGFPSMTAPLGEVIIEAR
ncbi:MAG: hypothetical protein OXI77_01470 [Chloroflexota bacterium]|nr:hypothetical protein [Chloroflexota bacterium]MDE2908612.1 hypothetical protein [Chloroflexota bacterium]